MGKELKSKLETEDHLYKPDKCIILQNIST